MNEWRSICHHLKSSVHDIYFSEKKRGNTFPLNIFCGWKQSLPGVCNHETYRLTGSKSACGWGVRWLLELPLPSGLQHLNHVSRAPPLCISPQKVMDILSLAAWPLVILFHRPAPCWSQHNGRRSASSQSIFRQTWSSKLVSFGKGMTKDLFNTLRESIKTSEQHVSFFFVLLLPSLATVCDFYPGFKLLCVFPTKLPPLLGGDQRLQLLPIGV